jgi:predicted AAA+ superfamily ATPase
MNIVPRHLLPVTEKLRKGYPAVLITGPRQSGKTTFAKAAFWDLPYVNLESPLERAELQNDPLGFLGRFPDGAILDEIQNVPEALSFLQIKIDEDGRQGRWALTGSQQLDLNRHVSQSLAGRVARLELLPFSLAEIQEAASRPRSLADAVLHGGYPPLHDSDRDLEPVRWLEDYLAAFVNRDIRSILQVRDRHTFDRFLRLCAAYTGQIFEAARLARDVGVDQKTIFKWLSVLEECYLIRLLRPHHRNFGKRITKRPKMYFLDSGLASRLLHIADVNQLRGHPQWGALVETWCVGEVFKARLNRGLPLDCWFWRTSDGYEVDLVIEVGNHLIPIEIKAGSTPYSEHGATIRKLRALSERSKETVVPPGIVIYGGVETRPCGQDGFVPWRNIDRAVAGLV